MSKAQKIILFILAAALVVVSVAAAVVNGREPDTIVGDFTPPPFEAAAVEGEPEVPDELGWTPLTAHESFVVSVCGELVEKDGKVAVWLYSDPDNDCWIKLRLLDERGNVLGETGLLMPGEYVQYLTIEKTTENGSPVLLKVMGYVPDTYYSAGSLGLQTVLNKTK